MCRTLTCVDCQLEIKETKGDKCVGSWAISDAVSTSISPSDTRRFVRLLLMDAVRGVQSVRPAHQGYHQVKGRRRGAEVRGVVVPAKTLLAAWLTNECMQKIGARVAGQTRLKLIVDSVDIIYSGRGMPFRCRNIITLLEDWVGIGWE